MHDEGLSMAGRRKKSDMTKTGKQKRMIILLEYLIDECLHMKEIPFSWLVDIYKTEFGYYDDNEETIEVTIKRDCSLFLKQGFIFQKDNKKESLIKAPIEITERLKNIWGFSDQKNRKLKKFLEEKYEHIESLEDREDRIYDEYTQDNISAFDVSVQIVQVILLREMDIEKETINRSNRHFFPFDIVVARDIQEILE